MFCLASRFILILALALVAMASASVDAADQTVERLGLRRNGDFGRQTSPLRLRAAESGIRVLGLTNQYSAPAIMMRASGIASDSGWNHGFSLNPMFGYSSNPENSSGGESGFVADLVFGLEWSYTNAINEVSLGYSAQALLFGQPHGDLDELNHEFAATFAHKFSETWSGSLTLVDSFYQADGDGVGQDIEFSPDITLRTGVPWLEAGIGYSLIVSRSYLDPSSPDLDPDAVVHRPSLSWLIDGDEVFRGVHLGPVVLSYQPGWNVAEGVSYDYRAHRAKLVLKDIPLVADRLSMKVEVAHEWRDHSAPAFDGSAVRRRDRILHWSAGISHPVVDRAGLSMALTLRYQGGRRFSTLDEFEFTEHRVLIGAEAEF